MVNKNPPSTKNRLLEQLRSLRETPVSGEELASAIGVSRVAIWKTTKALIAAGYPIEVRDSGYRIGSEATDDLLYPWEFGSHEGLMHYWSTTTSTMDRARELAEKGAADGSIAVAEAQTAGRGRAGRVWSSSRGGLFFTLVQTDRIPVLQYARGGMRAAAAVADAVRATTGAHAELRWPNDVYVGAKKIAGILTELRADGDRIKWTLIGIGVNVNNPGDGSSTISCGELAGTHLSRRKILNAFLGAFRDLARVDGGELAKEWNARAFGIGSRVAVLSADHGTDKRLAADSPDSIFGGIDELGRAIIETGKGTELLDPGAVSLKWS